MSIPDAIHIYIATRVSPLSAAGVEALLDAFDGEASLAPTHWGKNEQDNHDYDRETVTDAVRAFSGGDFFLCLKRSRPPRYLAYVDAMRARLHPKGLCHLKVVFRASLRKKDLAPIFRLGAALAATLHAEYGLVHPIWRLGDASQDYSAAGIVRPIDLQPYGPPGVAAHTWFGPHVAGLFGRDRLLGAGVTARETSWGGIELALTDTPWTADFETLRARQQAVMEALRPAEAFGDYRDIEPRKGAAWVPIPEDDGRTGCR